MAHVSAPGDGSESRLIVKALIVSSCLLSLVSWYTTQQGMALYLSSWFSVLASAGIQSALVLIAWLVGFSQKKRTLPIVVYTLTALISVAFSYVSLHTWFSARERPASVQRKLYDTLNSTTTQVESLLTAGIDEARRHSLALRELTAAEKSFGHISRAQDSDPYLAQVREAVAREAATYSTGAKEGAGEGIRYTAFDRYSELAAQTLASLQTSHQALLAFKARHQPLDPSDQQLRDFRQVYDAIPWTPLEQTLHSGTLAKPAVPNYSDYLDRTSSGQEDLMLAFQDLATQPLGTPLVALTLAAFIDVIVFLLAFSSGPYFHGSSERQWTRAAALLDTADPQVFARNFLRKLQSTPRGLPYVADADLTPGDRQLCLVLTAQGLAARTEEHGEPGYLLDTRVQEDLLRSLLEPGMALRAASASPSI